VAGVTAIYEMWVPMENVIRGSFNVAWMNEGEDGVIEVASTQSAYKANGKVHLTRPKHRYLELNSELDKNGKLRVWQTSRLV
jgi:hypothetical protein